MKTFWKKMFWWDAPAKGAFFALTLLLVGAYVLGSVFLLARELGWIERARLGVINSSSWPFLALFAILFLYYGILTLHFYYQAETGRSRYFCLPGFWIWLILLTSVALWAYPRDGYILPLAMAIYFTIILPISACFGKYWTWAITSIAAWIVAILMLWNSAGFFLFSFGTFPGVEGEVIPDVFPWIPLSEWLGISGYGWTLAWVGIAVLAFFGWYLLTGRLFAGLADSRFRSMFTRPVWLLLGIGLTVYLTFSGMALNEARKASQNIARLEQRFGRPLTVAAFSKLYFGNDHPDAEFWRRAEKLQSALKVPGFSPDPRTMFQFLSSPRLELSDTDFRKWRDFFEQKESGMAQWEKLCSGPIPPTPREYRAGRMYAAAMPNLRFVRKFNQIEMWRIRFALARNHTGDAVTAHRNMERINQSLLRDQHLLGGLVWLSGENLQLDAVELLLESEQLTDRQLREISSGLRETEKEIARVQECSLYGETVIELDFFDGLATGTAYITAEEENKALDLDAVGIFFPQYRWGNFREKSEFMRHLDVTDFSHIVSDSPGIPILCSTILPTYQRNGTYFQNLSARLQAMRTLIAAELWKREHGEYPDTRPSLSENPRPGVPLLYRKGESRIQVKHFFYNHNAERWDYRIKKRTVPTVQVWSPAAGDGGPENRTRAVMRLTESK